MGWSLRDNPVSEGRRTCDRKGNPRVWWVLSSPFFRKWLTQSPYKIPIPFPLLLIRSKVPTKIGSFKFTLPVFINFYQYSSCVSLTTKSDYQQSYYYYLISSYFFCNLCWTFKWNSLLNTLSFSSLSITFKSSITWLSCVPWLISACKFQ